MEDSFQVLERTPTPRPVRRRWSRQDPAVVGIILFALLDVMLICGVFCVTFLGRIDRGVVVDRRVDAGPKGHGYMILFRLEQGEAQWTTVPPLAYEAMTPGTAVYVGSAPLFFTRMTLRPALTAAKAIPSPLALWTTPMIVTVFLAWVAWVCILRPASWRRLVVHGKAARGRLVGASAVEFEKTRAEAVAEEAGDEEDREGEAPGGRVTMPITYEFQDTRGVRHQARFGGYNGRPSCELPSKDVTVVYLPSNPTRCGIYEAIEWRVG